MSNKRITSIIAGIGLYVLTTGISALAFGAFSPDQTAPITPLGSTPDSGLGALLVDPSEPKDQPCPVNGQLYTKTEKAAWEEQRPVLAMVENHIDARPQSGLSQADVVYEAIAEGGITRFMGVFYCGAIAKQGKIAPVRSARIYFVHLAPEYNTPLYVHVGGGNCSRDQETGECTSDRRAWALEELAKLGWRRAKGNDFDTTADIGRPVLVRDATRLGTDKELAVEHTMVGSLREIWKEATKRGFTGRNDDNSTWFSGFQPWTFKDVAANADRGSVTSIEFPFWDGYDDFDVRWEFDPATGWYKRINGGQPHTDLDNNEQLTASTVIIQFVKEEGPLDAHKHMFYTVIGKGKALVFQDGQATEATWEKKDQESRTVFKDAKTGKEISFVRGRVWIELVPAGNSVSY